MRFFLGCPDQSWFGLTSAPMFVSRRVLARRRSFYRARGPYAIDSGAFTEIAKHGRWTVSAAEYAAMTRVWRDEIGADLCAFIAPQDWMCEPDMLARTGMTVGQHQRRTVENFLELRAIAPDLPFAPVLQGWEPRDYVRMVAAYRALGVSLAGAVGVGTLCRRQATDDAVRVVRAIKRAAPEAKLHGFGVKKAGMVRLAGELSSADSMAWSFEARKSPPMDGCDHDSCSGCFRYAMRWRSRLPF